MEITIRLSGADAEVASVHGQAQQPNEATAAPLPSADLLTRAAAAGAINGGPAPIGPGAAAEPTAHIAATDVRQAASGSSDAGVSAGPAPGSAQGQAIAVPQDGA
jgi:hypothetical protein